MSLRLDNVAKLVEGRHHIHPTTLELKPGALTVLLGPTSAGKTTLMRLMAGLDRPTQGRVLWQGEDVTGVRVQDRKVAMVYQQFINYPAMRVYDNIASPLRLAGMGRDEIDARVRRAAELMRLTPQLERKPLELSGGQQQRCALARALVKNAGLVLLDEPLANLDYKLREELRAEIPRLFRESGAIFVYATTEPEEALLLGGEVATLWQGRVTQHGPTAEVYRAPADAITARVFSDPPMNFLAAEKRGDRLHLAQGADIPAPAALPDGALNLGFRANHLSLTPSADALEVPVIVRETEITGSESFIHLDHGSERWVALEEGVIAPEIGARITAYIPPAYLYAFDPDGALRAPAPYARAA